MIELAVGGIYAMDWGRREQWAATAVEISESLDDHALVAGAASVLALVQVCIGRVADWLATADIAARLFDGLDDPRLSLRLDAAVYLGWAECFLERYDAAGRHLDRGMALCRGTGQGQFLLPTMLGKAYTQMMQGQLDEANDLAEEATEAERVSQSAPLMLWALWTRSWAAAMTGDLEKALAAGDEALGLVDECGPSVPHRRDRLGSGRSPVRGGRGGPVRRGDPATNRRTAYAHAGAGAEVHGSGAPDPGRSGSGPN